MVPEHTISVVGLPGGIRPATYSDRGALVDLLCRAFDRDPVMNWLLRQDGGREAAFRRFFTLSVRMTMPHGLVFISEDARGAALWTPPGKWRAGRLRQLWQGPGLARAIGLGRLGKVIPVVATIETQHPKAPHFYLYELGVVPERHGRGLGSELLRHGLERCDAAGVGAYLESSSPRNVPLYERFGFQVTRTLNLGPDGPPISLMWRAPSRRGP
jgi:ribosomal protein S18 acetylase RimI-like enzyme